MFEVDMKERGDGSVTLGNQCPVAVASFLDFAYSGETLITDGNVDTLFQLASFLQVETQPVFLCSFFKSYTIVLLDVCRNHRLLIFTYIDIFIFGHVRVSPVPTSDFLPHDDCS